MNRTPITTAPVWGQVLQSHIVAMQDATALIALSKRTGGRFTAC